MNIDLKPIDCQKYKCKISAKFICDTSQDDFISIVTDNGIIIYKLLPLSDNTLVSPSHTKLFLKPSQYIVSRNLGIDIDPILESLKQEELYECVLRNDTSDCLDNCVKTKYVTTCLKWSPVGLIGSQCVLAVLNDSGSLDLYTKINQYGDSSFQHILNVSEIGIKFYKRDWINVSSKLASNVFEEFKRRLEMNYISAFIFSHLIEINSKKFCILIVSYKSGLIAFWKINYTEIKHYKDVNISLMCDYQTNKKHITAMHWIESENSGLLCLGNLKGNVTILPITDIKDNTLTVSKEVIFSEDDELRVDNISSSIYKNEFYIYIIKQSYLIIHLLNTNGQLLDTCTFLTGNISIVGLQILKNNKLIISNVTGVVKEINVYSKDKQIQLEWRHLYVNINWSLRRCLGFFISKNSLIYTFIIDSCKMYDAKRQKDFINLASFVNKSIDALDIILKNKTNSLRDYVDCFDTVRLLSIIDKQPICQKIPSNLDYNKLNLCQLKTYLYLAKLNEYVTEQKDTLENSTMLSFKELHNIIEIKLAIYYVQRILNKIESNLPMNDFMKKSLKMLVGYMKFCIMKDVVNFNLWPNCVEELLDVISRTRKMDLSIMTKCIICENDLIGNNCLNQHMDVRCSVSLTQIISLKYKCSACQKVVSEECIEDFQVTCCPFCDLPLDFILAAKPSGKEFNEFMNSLNHKEEYSKMFYDDELINKII